VIAAKLDHSGVNRIKGLRRFRKTRLNGQIIAMTDGRDLCEGLDSAVAESAKRAAAERKAAEDQAFANKLAKRPPPNPVERAEIEKGESEPRPHVEDRGKAGSVVYPTHSDDEGHDYRLADGDARACERHRCQCSDPASSLGSSSAWLHGASI
jgi:hypothetical protein